MSSGASDARVRPLKRAEYDRLVELGCFQDEKVELLDGVLVEMRPQGVPHANAIRVLRQLLRDQIGARAIVDSQLPIALDDRSEPEPDVAVIPRQDYSRAHPSSALLIVEVADSSLRKDRLLKRDVYARNAVPEYWIVNLAARTVEVYREPQGDQYGRLVTYGEADTISPEAFVDVVIPVAQILPPPTP